MSHDIRTAQSQSVCVQIVMLLVARIHYFFSSLVSFSPGRCSLDLSKYNLNSTKRDLRSRETLRDHVRLWETMRHVRLWEITRDLRSHETLRDHTRLEITRDFERSHETWDHARLWEITRDFERPRETWDHARLWEITRDLRSRETLRAPAWPWERGISLQV